MTAATRAFLVVAGLAAIIDWIAVGRSDKRTEYVAKPLTMAALVVVALTIDTTPDARQAWFVAAGVFSLAGDVFLMLRRDRFLQGLVAFLLAHVCYVVGLVQAPLHAWPAVVGLIIVTAAVTVVGRVVLRAVRANHPALLGPVIVYLVVIATMVVTAWAAGPAVAIGGATLFFASDSILALQRFVRPMGWAPVAVMVTYHLGQAGLILSLAPD